MIKVYKIAITVFLLGSICSCFNAYESELARTGKSGAALGRIGASQTASDSVFKDME